MHIVSLGDSLYEISNSYFPRKKEIFVSLSSAEFAQRMQSVNVSEH